MSDDNAAFYASTEYGIGRFLTVERFGPATKDTRERLIARVDDPFSDPLTHRFPNHPSE